MLTQTANEDSRLSFWLRVREFAVAPSMIETATARRHAGDWSGACAAAGVDVETRRGTGTGPVADVPAGGRGLDHGGRHCVLPYAAPEGKAGIPVRDVWVHQHSPCADGTPILSTE